MTDKFIPAAEASQREAGLRAEISHLREYNLTLLGAMSAIKVSGYDEYAVREIMVALADEVLILKDQRARLVKVSDEPHRVLDLSDLIFDLPAQTYLTDLAERLMRVPALYEIDQGDVAQVGQIAERIRDVQESIQ